MNVIFTSRYRVGQARLPASITIKVRCEKMPRFMRRPMVVQQLLIDCRDVPAGTSPRCGILMAIKVVPAVHAFANEVVGRIWGPSQRVGATPFESVTLVLPEDSVWPGMAEGTPVSDALIAFLANGWGRPSSAQITKGQGNPMRT
jgi:hypothetical protein